MTTATCSEGRLCVTGFGAFPGVAINPTQRVIECLQNASEGTATHDFFVVDVSYQRALEQIVSIIEGGVDTVVMLGVATRASQIRVEKCARNHRQNNRADADGLIQLDPVCADDPIGRVRTTSVAVERVVQELNEAGLAAVSSQDAGDYLCNYTYYHALREAERRRPPTSVVFAHLPPIGASQRARGGSTWSLDDLLDAVDVLMKHFREGQIDPKSRQYRQ